MSTANKLQSTLKAVIQPKLSVNHPRDQYEQEADAMADQVMRMAVDNTPVTGIVGKSVKRKCAECEEEEKEGPVMRKTQTGSGNFNIPPSFSSSLASSKGSGSSLPENTKSFMENAFSVDFSKVRIHTGNRAAEMSKGINARAFTYGNDIYFDNGQFAPNSYQGKKLLAHELMHTLQQSNSNTTIQRFANCNAAQNQIIRSALVRARRRSTRAIQIVTEIQAGTNPRALATLQRFFGPITSPQITAVHDRMVAADVHLNNNAMWRCDTHATYHECGGRHDWVAGTTCPTTSEPSHLCPFFFEAEADTGGAVEPSRAMLLIHEGLRAAGACGGDYPPGNRTPPASIENVFSYTDFMFAVASASR